MTPSTQRNKHMLQHDMARQSMTRRGLAQHSTAQHSTAQHSTAQHSTAQHSTAQHSTAQHAKSTRVSPAHHQRTQGPLLLKIGSLPPSPGLHPLTAPPLLPAVPAVVPLQCAYAEYTLRQTTQHVLLSKVLAARGQNLAARGSKSGSEGVEVCQPGGQNLPARGSKFQGFRLVQLLSSGLIKKAIFTHT